MYEEHGGAYLGSAHRPAEMVRHLSEKQDDQLF